MRTPAYQVIAERVASQPPRPQVRLVGVGPPQWGPPLGRNDAGPVRSPLLAGAVLLLVVVVVASLVGERRDLATTQRTTVRATIGAVSLDDGLHLDVEVVNAGPPARLVDAQLLMTGAQEGAPLRLRGAAPGADGGTGTEAGEALLGTGSGHVVGDLRAQCGPEGPLAPLEGSVLVRFVAGAAPLELRAELPVGPARVAAERACRPLVVTGLLSLGVRPPGVVRLMLGVRTRAAGRVHRVERVLFAGRPVVVPEQALPVFAGVPGIDSVTSFAVEVPASCAGQGAGPGAAGGLEAVIDGAAVPVELDASAQLALQDQRASCG